MRNLTLQLDNMHCGACVRRVLQVLSSIPSTHTDEVRVGSARIRTGQSDDEVCAALTAAGFPARIEQVTT